MSSVKKLLLFAPLLITVTILSIGSVRGWTAAKNRAESYPCSYARHYGNTWRGGLSLDDARRLRAKSVRLGKGIPVRLNHVTQQSAPAVISCLARAYDVDVGTALSVAQCESHADPEAYNPGGYGGIFQQDVNYWPGRAAAYGHKGASVFDGYANAHVSIQMVRDGGWGPWACA